MSTVQQEHLKVEQLQHASRTSWSTRGARAREPGGLDSGLATEAEIREALEKAFDYRGDITVTRKDGSMVEGYLFDRRRERRWRIRWFGLFRRRSRESRERVNWLCGCGGAAVYRTDTAAGKTFDAWVKKYWEKKAAGEKNIQIEPEKLD